MSKELVRKEIEKARNLQRQAELNAKQAEQDGDELSALVYHEAADRHMHFIGQLQMEGIDALRNKMYKQRGKLTRFADDSF